VKPEMKKVVHGTENQHGPLVWLACGTIDKILTGKEF
jgi:hypothetical protein